MQQQKQELMVKKVIHKSFVSAKLLAFDTYKYPNRSTEILK